MTIKEIIQKLYTAITDACLQESHFESWLILNEVIIDAIDALKALDNQEPVAWTEQQFFDDGTPHPCSALKWAGRNEQDDFPVGTKFYTTPPQRKPLTDEEMKKIWYAMQNIMGWYSFEEVARAIEAAHNIRSKND